jgi:hypothetical protein
MKHKKNPSKSKQMISLKSTIIATQNQVSSDLGEETAILNLKNGMYYTLDETGTWIWNLIQKEKTVGQIRDAILDIYEVDPESCEHDLFALLQDLAAEELIEIKHEVVA